MTEDRLNELKYEIGEMDEEELLENKSALENHINQIKKIIREDQKELELVNERLEREFSKII